MRNRREWLFGSLTALLSVAGRAEDRSVLEVTYYFLPG
jgi:hypothetical protein